MTAAEFSRPVPVDTLGTAPKQLSLEADAAERAALARRFGLAAIGRLTAEVSLTVQNGAVMGAGMVVGEVTQNCVVTGEPVEAHVEAPVEIAFRPQPGGEGHDEEIELAETELDTVFYEGGAVDIGEAVAETLLLNLDPYPRAPEAGAALKAAGVKSEEEAGPFAALAELKDKLKGG
jgi:uncharacterized metal-binding protein YceD (DUF177 family)